MTQLDRVENLLTDMDRRVRDLADEVAEMRGERRGAARVGDWIHKVLTIIVAVGAGYVGSHFSVPPGGH